MKRIVILLAIIAPLSASAAVPQDFNLQGVLRNSAGQLQSMSVTVTANFWGTSTGGTTPLVAYGPYTNVPVANGLFSLQIPAPNLISSIDSQGQVYLELIVGNDSFPRQPVSPDIYALMCSQADNTLAVGGVPVASPTPTTGQALVYDGAKYSPTSVLTTTGQAADSAKLGGVAASNFIQNTTWAGFIDQDAQVAGGSGGSTTSTTFVDSPFPAWTVNIPVAKTYLLEVDALVASSSTPTISWQVVATPVAGGSAVTVTNPSMLTNVFVTGQSIPANFRTKIALPSAGMWTIKLQWLSVQGTSISVGSSYPRSFSIVG